VAGNDVHQHAQAALARLGQEAVEVLERPKDGIDALVVGDVVAEVGQRRGIDRRQPQRVDAEPAQMVEPRSDAAKVPDPVAV
jgi:hypothetical protein